MERKREAAEVEAAQSGELPVLQAAAGILLATNDSAWGELLGCAVPSLPPRLRLELQRFLEGEIDLEPASWWLVATALATSACSGSPSSTRILACAARLKRAPQWVHAAFLHACIARISGTDDGCREAWLVDLERPLEIVRPSEPAGGRVRVYRRESSWDVRDPFDVWNNPPIALEAVDDHLPTTILRALAPDRWLQAVERWKDAPLVTAALFGAHVFQDRSALLRWLAAAQPAFDVDLRWTGKLAVLVLAHHVIRAAQALVEAVASERVVGHEPPDRQVEAALEALRDAELPRFFTAAWEALLARPDGAVIGCALHASLSDPTPRQRRHRDRGVDVRRIARDHLTGALRARALRTQEIRLFWEERRRLRDAARLGARVATASGVCALVSALDLIGVDGLAEDNDLAAMFVESLSAPDPDWPWLAREGVITETLEPFVNGLARRGDAFERCEHAYAALEVVRRAGEYGRTYAKNDMDTPSVLLLIVLLGLLDEAERDDPRTVDRLRNCHAWVVRLLLTSSPAFEPTMNPDGLLAFTLRLWAKLAPHLFAEAFEVARPDPALAALCAASLIAAPGIDAEALLAGVDETLDTIEIRAREWAGATGRPHDKRALEQLVNQRKVVSSQSSAKSPTTANPQTERA